MPRINYKYYSGCSNRKEVIINRPWIYHTRLTHSFITENRPPPPPPHSPLCDHCDRDHDLTVKHTVKPRISGHRISGNLAIRTYMDGDGFFITFILVYPEIPASVSNSKLGHKNTNWCAKMSQKSGMIWVCPECFVFLSIVFRRYHYQNLLWLIIQKCLWYATSPIHRTGWHDISNRRITNLHYNLWR